jgi:hypothetical protein
MSALKRIAHHARANVVAYLALFIALGGTSAYAANTIGSGDIIDESIQTQDLKNGQVKSQDLASDAVGSTKILDDNILGRDIRNQTLTAADIAPGAIGPAALAPALAAQVHGVPEPVPSGESTTLHATTEQFDQGGLHVNTPADDNVFLTAPVAGIYAVTATVTWAPNAVGNRIAGIVGPPGGGTDSTPALGDGAQTTQNLSAIYRIPAGGSVNVAVAQNSGSPLDASVTFFTMTYVGALSP